MAIDFQPDESKLDFQLDFQPDEETKPKKGFWKQLGADTLGTATGIADVAAGAIKAPAAVLAANIGSLVDPSLTADEHRRIGQEAIEETFPSIGRLTGTEDTVGHQAVMYPFQKIGEGIEWLGDKIPNKRLAGAAKLTADTALLTAGIPGTKLAGKGLGKVAEAIDPGLRNAGRAVKDEAAVRAKQAEIDAATPKAVEPIDFQPTNETAQLDLFDLSEQGKAANKYEAQEGYWTQDENGIPIRADLSMEAQNLQTPLQRGLWGEEMPVRENPRGQAAGLPMDRDILGHERISQPDRMMPENEVPLTQAIDKMPDMPWKAERDSAVELLKHELEASGELKAAKMEADTLTTARSPYIDPTIRRVPKGQRGAINPEVFKEGFEKLKQLADGTWLRAFSENGEFRVEAIKDGHRLGETAFGSEYRNRLKSNEKDLSAWSTRVRPENRRQGIASEMYKFAKELGNDIKPSDIQTAEGKAMWSGFQQKGILSGPAKRQVGAVWVGERRQRQLEKVLGKQDLIPDNPDPKQVVTDALTEGKDGKSVNNLESGSTLAAMKRGSAAIQGASRIIQNAVKRADLAIRRNVFPVEKAFRSLSKAELASVANILKLEMFQGKRFDKSALESLTLKQQEAYAHLRHMFDDTLRIQNEARAAKGQEPITEMEAYLSSRWQGDFRRPLYQAKLKNGEPVFDKEGNPEKQLVWYLASNTKRGLEKQTKALLNDRPDLTFDPKDDHVVRYYKRETDLQSAYSTVLDIIGRDNPAVKAMKEAVEAQTVNEGASFLGHEKHFKEKTGVRGFVGDRPGRGGPSEALAMIQQQIQYAKNAYKWSELQKAADDIKTIISDPKLVEQQPNNVKYIRDYYKNAIGYGEHKAIAHLEDAVRDLGLSPAVLNTGVGGLKSFFILQKLAVSAGYTVANILQTANVLPHIVNLYTQGYHGNPLTAIPVGIFGGLAMGTGHYLSFLNNGKYMRGVNPDQAGFLMRAFKYAEDNGVTARSIYDEAPIESSFSTTGRVGNIAGKTMAVPETFVRSMSYMTFVQFLKDSGKFRTDLEVFQKAEELTNAAMVDYRSQERPLVFQKLGTIGNFLNTLQTYPINWYQQWNLMAREAGKGNIAPFAAMLAVQYAVAGASGVPGFDDAIKLYDTVKEMLPADDYQKLQESDFWHDPKMWMVKNFGQDTVYGWLSDKTGIGITSRVAAPGMGQMIQAPGGPAIDIAKQGWNAVQAVADPTNTTKLAQVAMSSTPPGLQGMVEQAPFMENKTFVTRQDGARVYGRPGNLEDRRGVVTRTPQEETIRNFGLRSQREVLDREAGYRYDHATSVAGKKAQNIPNAFYDAIKRGDRDRAKDLDVAYIKLTGKGISNEMLETQIKQEYMTTMERSQSAAKTISAIQNAARMRALLESIRKENDK